MSGCSVVIALWTFTSGATVVRSALSFAELVLRWLLVVPTCLIALIVGSFAGTTVGVQLGLQVVTTVVKFLMLYHRLVNVNKVRSFEGVVISRGAGVYVLQ